MTINNLFDNYNIYDCLPWKYGPWLSVKEPLKDTPDGALKQLECLSIPPRIHFN